MQKRAPLAGAEGAHHHSSGTINVSCPVEDAAADAGPAAKAALMYISNQRAWLGEPYRTKLRQIGQSWRACLATRDMQFQDRHKPKNLLY